MFKSKEHLITSPDTPEVVSHPAKAKPDELEAVNPEDDAPVNVS